MYTRKAMKLVPMLVMLAALACASYAVQPEVVGPMPASAAAPEKRTEAAGKTSQPPAPSSRRTDAPENALALRDPFRVASTPGQDPAGPGPEQAGPAPDRAEVDPYPEMVAGLTLSGTFLQGRTRMAIIDGRIHEQGERLRGPGDEPSPLVVADVQATLVILQAASGGKRYVLAYPETWADPSPGGAGGRPATGQPRAVRAPKLASDRKPAPRRPASP
jgi:hypothetical protein